MKNIFTHLTKLIRIESMPLQNNKTKDFLAFHGYSSNKEFKLITDEIIKCGYSVDLVDENNIGTNSLAATYRFILLCWHDDLENWSKIERTIKQYPNAVLVQFDDTDWSDHIMGAGKLRPHIIFKRELTNDISSSVPCYPFPKTAPDLLNNSTRDIPVSCILNNTNARRARLIDFLSSFKKEDWVVKMGAVPFKEYVNILNRSKIEISFYGNGFDTIRFWEILSCGAALLTPRIPLIIPDIDESCLVYYKNDFEDLKQKIYEMLENDNWRSIGESGRKLYVGRHSPRLRARYLLDKIGLV